MSQAIRENLTLPPRGSDGDAWDQFWNMYRPLLRRYAARFKIDDRDAQDLEQDVYVKLQRLVAGPTTLRSRPAGWLRGTTDNKICDWLRSRQHQLGHLRPMAEYLYHIQQFFSGSPVAEEQRRAEWRRFVMQLVLQRVGEEFPPRSAEMACFQRICIQGHLGAEAAAELRLESAAAAYAAAWRVLERIRELCAVYDEEICDAGELPR